MTKKLSSLFIMVLTLLSMSSCLGTSEDKTTYYDDTAITAFSLGTLNLTKKTKTKDGLRDSTIKTTYNANSYQFNIDQVNHLIYNTDSLPYGTDAAHVLATITSKNSGTVILMLKNTSGKDSLVYYNTKDSINFTQPVKMRVYNMVGSAYRDYTVKVNVHKENGNEFTWNSNSVSGLELTTDQKFVNHSENWNNVASAASLVRIIGATPKCIYALTTNGISISRDNGVTWVKDSIDTDASKLPDTDINFICQEYNKARSIYSIVLVGNKNNKTVVWSKAEENNNTANAQPWTFYTEDENNRKILPYLSGLQVIAYDGGLLAIGGNMTKFYYSPDNGLTWTVDSNYPFPEGFNGSSSAAMGRNDKNIIFLTKTGSAQVYTARRARLGWEISPKVFTE